LVKKKVKIVTDKEDNRKMKEILGSVLRVHNLHAEAQSQAQGSKSTPLSTEVSPDYVFTAVNSTRPSTAPSPETLLNPYLNPELFEYISTITASVSLTKSFGNPNTTENSSNNKAASSNAPFAWKWNQSGSGAASTSSAKSSKNKKSSSAKSSKKEHLSPPSEIPSDTSSFTSYASSAKQSQRKNKTVKAKVGPNHSQKSGDGIKDSSVPKTFRSSTAERLAMPKAFCIDSQYPADSEFGKVASVVASYNAKAKNNYLNRDGGSKSAGVMMGTQTPREQERLLTPTIVRKKLKCMSASAGQTPRTTKTVPNLDTNKELPLVPKTKAETGAQTGKVRKERPKTPKVSMKAVPKISVSKKTKELTIKSSSEEESPNKPDQSPAAESITRSALKTPDSVQPHNSKRPGSVRFVDEELSTIFVGESGIKRHSSSEHSNKSVKFALDDTTIAAANIQDLPGRPISAESSTVDLRLNEDIVLGKLKKVKVSTTKSADHIGLTYRRRSTSNSLRDSSSSKLRKAYEETFNVSSLNKDLDQDEQDTERKRSLFDAFSNVTMIAPSTLPQDAEFVDLNIIVRRSEHSFC
jgi:hypothetical protein